MLCTATPVRVGQGNFQVKGGLMKVYNAVGYALILAYALGCLYLAPPHLGPWAGLGIGAAYFLVCWFMGGLYLSSVIHMGIAHRALDYQEWFVKALTVVNNTFGVYIDPISWVNRHRLHHKFADHAGDPNKLASDGFWRTLYLCLLPYKCEANMATDAIFGSWPFRLVSNPVFMVAAQAFNFWLLWLLVGDWRFAAAMWVVFRIWALWINMIQNYWTHERRFGYRRYDDADNAMNIGEWLPVTATFSACLQNNHHHSPGLLRLSHDESEYDFGFMTVKAMKALGLVRATPKGATLPNDVPLESLGF
ncbi:MAG TPA: fatty acid desaturase [Gammaproteobacteria bacterium]|jgi:stearoyl-CoA desaturase (delta-9 desaturase)|nr:fatty acid desaturase [Gammaproteobacteria bacterium]